MHPAGYGAAWDDRSRAELEQLEQWRAAAVAPLAELKRGWRTAQNVGQMLRRLDEFLDRITLADRIDAQAAELEQAGCGTLDEVHERIKRAFGFPDYYGENWDAMWDCMDGLFDRREIMVRGF